MAASSLSGFAVVAPELAADLPEGLSFFVLAALAWLFTYALHSTLLLSSAWIVTRRLADARAGLRERVWKFAVLAAFVTASLQVGLGFEPLGGRLPLQRTTAQIEGLPAAATPVHEVQLASAPAPVEWMSTTDALLWPARLIGAALAAASPGGESAAPSPMDGHESLVATLDAASPEATDRAEPVAAPTPAWLSLFGGWTRWAFASCALGASAGLLLFALLWVRLNGRLRDRVELRHGALADTLRRLCERAKVRRPVRLSVAPSLGAPISMGMFRSEICVPPRVLLELSTEEQEALLAHELAHVVRRDPLWLAICRLCEGVFFFQPLNRVARREIEDCAEFLSDAWAVRQTGLRYSLASCLTRIAEWIVGERRALPAPAMAHGRSRLRHRVELLLDEEATDKLDRPPHWLGAACLGFSCALIACVPCVSATEEALEIGDGGGLSYLPARTLRFEPRASSEDAASTECEEPDAEESLGLSEDPFEELGDQLGEELQGLGDELELLRKEALALHLHGDISREIALELAQLEMKLARLRELSARLSAVLQADSAPGAHATPAALETSALTKMKSTLFLLEDIPQ